MSGKKPLASSANKPTSVTTTTTNNNNNNLNIGNTVSLPSIVPSTSTPSQANPKKTKTTQIKFI